MAGRLSGVTAVVAGPAAVVSVRIGGVVEVQRRLVSGRGVVVAGGSVSVAVAASATAVEDMGMVLVVSSCMAGAVLVTRGAAVFLLNFSRWRIAYTGGRAPGQDL